MRDRRPKPSPPLQTSATPPPPEAPAIVADLKRILHDHFTGTVEVRRERGALAWVIEDTFRAGRVRLEREQPRNLELVGAELEMLLSEGGRVILHCNDGAVVRYARRRELAPGGAALLEE